MVRRAAISCFDGCRGHKRFDAKPRFTCELGQTDLVSPDKRVFVDNVLEVAPEVVEEAAGARVEIPGQKKGLEVGRVFGIFDGTIHIGAVERAPHLFDWKQRTIHTVIGEHEAIELIQRPATPPKEAPRQMPGAEIQGQRAPGVNASTKRPDGINRLRREGRRARDKNDAGSQSTQCLEVIHDVRIDDTLRIEVGE